MEINIPVRALKVERRTTKEERSVLSVQSCRSSFDERTCFSLPTTCPKLPSPQPHIHITPGVPQSFFVLSANHWFTKVPRRQPETHAVFIRKAVEQRAAAQHISTSRDGKTAQASSGISTYPASHYFALAAVCHISFWRAAADQTRQTPRDASWAVSHTEAAWRA